MISNLVLNELEFPKVLEYISKYAVTEKGKSNVLNIRPLPSIFEVRIEGQYVSEAKEILIKNDVPPIIYLPDLLDVLSTSTIEGAVLGTKQILDVLNLAEISRRVFQFIKNNAEHVSLNNDIASRLFIDKVFEHHISKIFTDTGEIKDNASTKLREIRIEIRERSDQLKRVVQRLLKQLSEAYLVQEEYMTLRDGRIVLPIKAEHKRHVKGFIHSESSTGQTVYIEPEETLELNNEILSLSFAEKREIERILKSLTQKIGEVCQELKEAHTALSELDSIFARAKYSLEIMGNFPEFDNEKPFHLMDARHPILMKKVGRDSTIPLNLKIENENIILVTGPNAGGKTVVLKCVGLLTLSALSGIHIPASADSNLHFVSNILVDIGDRQSIEDDLSTFSSHLSNIREILKNTDSDSLVLIDEIGTGTDPAEGSALAMAVLILLQKTEAKVLATTHHGNLKLYANDLEGFQNASMEFDTENLKPTYIFHQGLPGSSYAFEVAERIGFDKNFVNLAKQYLDINKTKIENFLVQLETRSRDVRKQLNTLEIENTRLKGLANLYQNKVNALEKQKKEILKKTEENADIYLKNINKKVEAVIKQIRESSADKKIIKAEREKLENIISEHIERMETVDETDSVEKYTFNLGDYVSLKNTQTSGILTEINKDKKRAELTSGSIRLQVKLDDLIPAKKKEVESSQGAFKGYSSIPKSFRLDIRGKKPEEIEFELVRFLDDAFTTNLDSVEVLHGKGTGVLKSTVHEILRHHEHVKTFQFADIEYGGEGITIVKMD